MESLTQPRDGETLVLPSVLYKEMKLSEAKLCAWVLQLLLGTARKRVTPAPPTSQDVSLVSSAPSKPQSQTTC